VTAQQQATLDSQYQADQASLANEISQRYNDVLKQLGYMDPNTGQFIMGTVETEANRQAADLQRSQGLAAEQATQQRQLEGTLFSGRRATEQARAEHPFVQGLADLDISTPQSLSDLYEQAGNLMSEYTSRNNQALAGAAQRQAAAIQAHPAAPTPPPATPPPPPGPGPIPGPEGGVTPPSGPFVAPPATSNVSYVGGAGAWTPNVPSAGGQVTDVYPNTGVGGVNAATPGYQPLYLDTMGNVHHAPGPGLTQVY
jgi:hypothetical protein